MEENAIYKLPDIESITQGKFKAGTLRQWCNRGDKRVTGAIKMMDKGQEVWVLPSRVFHRLMTGKQNELYSQLRDQYLLELKSGGITGENVSPKYLETSEEYLDSFWQKLNIAPSIQAVNAENLRAIYERYLPNEEERRDYHATKNNYYKVITGFMRLLIREKYKTLEDLAAMRENRPVKRFELKKEAYDLEFIEQVRNRNRYHTTGGRSQYDRKLFDILVALYGYCGVRRFEPLKLPVKNINLSDGHMLVYGKGAKERTCVIFPELASALVDWLEFRQPSKYLLSSEENELLTTSAVNNRFYRFSVGTGLKVKPHNLRISFATLAAKYNMPVPLLQYHLGHTHITTTQGYMMITDKHLIEWNQQNQGFKVPSLRREKSDVEKVEPINVPSFQWTY